VETPGGSRPPLRREFKTELATVCFHLNEAGARYLLIGARALQLWGSARATRDIDILIEPTEENAGRVLSALAQVGFGFAREWSAREIAARFVTIIGDSPRVDILTLAWSVRYRDAVRSATVFELEGIRIPTASLEQLIASKRTGRPQDEADILVLEEIKRLRGL
jgi:predicted nucleotidyltransferase